MDRLSDALGRQQEIGLMIGDELDTHVDMLEDTDHLVERAGNRLQIASKQLSKVARGTKGCGKDDGEKDINEDANCFSKSGTTRTNSCRLHSSASCRIMDDHYGPNSRSHHCH